MCEYVYISMYAYTHLCPYTCMCVYIYVCATFFFIIDPIIYGQALGLFPDLATVNNDAMNLGVHISLRDPDFIFFGYILISEIAGSYSSSSFNFLRNSHIVLHSSNTYLHFHQQCTRVSYSPHPPQRLLSIFFIDDSYFSRYKGIPHCSFDLGFPDD